MHKAKSLWYTGPESIELREISIPAPGAHEVLVRLDACGVCTWDLFIFSGGFQAHTPYPFYFGHEGVGTITEIGPGVTRVTPGDRVALRESPIIGAPASGHMAEYAIQREEVVIPLPHDEIPSTLWMVEPVACCVNAVNLVPIPPGARVALVGCGFMGGIILELLSMSPAAEIAVFDVRHESLQFARSWKESSAPGGAPISIHDISSGASGTEQGAAKQGAAKHGAADTTEGLAGSFDIVIETAATAPAFRLADQLTRPGGTLVIFSWHHHDITFDFGSWHVRGITVVNASPAAAPDMRTCFLQSVPLISSKRIDLSPLTTHVAKPEAAPSLYQDGLYKQNGYIKGVIDWS